MDFTVIVDHLSHINIFRDNKPGEFKYLIPKSGKYQVCLKNLFLLREGKLPKFIHVCIQGINHNTYISNGWVNAIKTIPLDSQKKNQSFTFDTLEKYILNLCNSDTLEICIKDDNGKIIDLNVTLCLNFSGSTT